MEEKVRLTRKELKAKHKEEIKHLKENLEVERNHLLKDIWTLIEGSDEEKEKVSKIYKEKSEQIKTGITFRRSVAQVMFFGTPKPIRPTVSNIKKENGIGNLTPNTLLYTDNIMKEIEEAQYTLYQKFIDIESKCYLILSDVDFKRLEAYHKDVLKKQDNSRLESITTQLGEIIVKETRTTETSHLLAKRKEGNVFGKCNLGTNEIITSN